MRIALPRSRPTVTLAVVLVVIATLFGSARATSTFAFTRFSGTDRYDTGRLVATNSFQTAPTVVLATGENFPDALAGSYLAADIGGPILLTRKDAVPQRTNEALVALSTTTVLLLGGEQAISQAVEVDLRGRGYTVTRIKGDDRYETAVAAASRPGAAKVGTVDAKKTAFLANARTFADALAAGPLSYKGKLPILLTEADALPEATKKALTDLGIQHVIILGGTGAVSDKVKDEVAAIQGTTVERIAGADRTETATKLADFGVSKLNFVTTHVNLARGDDAGLGADALAGGPHAGKEAAAIILSATATALDGSTNANATWLRKHQATLETGHIFGGFVAVSGAVENQAAQAAGVNPPEAGAGTSTPTVASVNLPGDYFISSASATYYYDNNDTFRLKGSDISFADFESLLNPDDSLSVTYDPNASGKSTWNITNDVVHATDAPAGSPVDADGDGARDDVRVSVIVPKNNSTGTLYTLQRAPYFPPSCQGAQQPFTDVAGADMSDGRHDDLNPAEQTGGNGCFAYRVVARSPIGTSVATSAASAPVAVPGSADTTAPTITDARATLDTGSEQGTVSAGDKHRFHFSEVMKASSAQSGASYQLSDSDGTVVQITCGTNATCTLSTQVVFDQAAQRPVQFSRLEVTVNDGVVVVNSGSNAGLQYPGTVTTMNNQIQDEAGNPVNVPGSPDTFMEVAPA